MQICSAVRITGTACFCGFYINLGVDAQRLAGCLSVRARLATAKSDAQDALMAMMFPFPNIVDLRLSRAAVEACRGPRHTFDHEFLPDCQLPAARSVQQVSSIAITITCFRHRINHWPERRLSQLLTAAVIKGPPC